jgi:hypothetical protein
VIAQGTNQNAAEQAAMNALARAFKTDVAGLSQASQRMNQLIADASGKKTVTFEQNQSFSQEVNTTTNIRGLIGVQTDLYRAGDGTHYVNARMNRRECGARYSGMIQENAAVINQLLTFAGNHTGFDAYSALSFAAAIAEVTDNFQNILEVLDSSAVSRRPGYGGANAIKARMRQVAGTITVGVAVQTQDRNDASLITRALASFFKDRGFRSSEQGAAPYMLKMNVRFDALTFNSQMKIYSCRYYIDAVLEARNNSVLFSFTEDSRANHLMEPEAKRMAVRGVETSIKEKQFAVEFDAWLNSLVD